MKSKVWFDAIILIALTLLAKGVSIQFSDELAGIFKKRKRETERMGDGEQGTRELLGIPVPCSLFPVPRFLYLCFTDCL